jgi:hypothetical protein
LQIPIDKEVTQLYELPFTLSYVIRKRAQVDNLMELPKDKKPPDSMLWDGTADEIENWLDRVLYQKQPTMSEFTISEKDFA